jgi:hypothetical protein
MVFASSGIGGALQATILLTITGQSRFCRWLPAADWRPDPD